MRNTGRYKQTAIGITWAIIRPLLTMVVLTVIFGRVAKLPAVGAPYAIMVLSATLPWEFFSATITEGSMSLVNNAQMVNKIYFPRIVLPGSAMMVNLVDFVISFIILLIMMAAYTFAPSWRIVTLPVFLLLAMVTAMGFNLWVSAACVKYRDFRYIVQFIVQFGLYVSPVGFSSSVVSDKWRLLYSMNPMVGVIDGFRWAIIGKQSEFYLPGFLISVALMLLVLWTGMLYFRKTEKVFADVI